MIQKLLFGFFITLFTTTAQAQLHFSWASQTAGASNLALTHDQYSNLYIAGKFGASVDFDPGVGVFNQVSVGQSDIFVQKLDPSGNLVWVKQFGGLLSDGATSIDVDPRGEVLVTGYFSGTVNFGPNLTFTAPVDSSHIFILKLNKSGNLLWAKHLNATSAIPEPALKTDPHGNSYILGSFQGMADFDPDPIATNILNAPNEAMFVLKLTPDGQLEWAEQMEGIGNSYSKGYALDVKRDYVYITGNFNGQVDFDPNTGTQIQSNPHTVPFIQKLDKAGNLLWVKQLDATNGGAGYALAVDQAGNVLTTGYFTGDMDIDPGPGAQLFSNAGISDLFLLKLNSEGDFVWGKQVGSGGRESGLGVTLDDAGNVYTTGYYEGYMDFDPGPATHFLNGFGGQDMFLLKLSPEGDFVEANAIGGINTDSGRALEFDPDGNLVLIGHFQNTADFDTGPAVFSMQAASSPSAFMLKLTGPWDYRGTVFEDLNGNALQDANEPGMPGILLGTTSGEAFATTDYAGKYHFYRSLEGDSLYAVPPHDYWSVVPSSLPIDSLQSNLNFALVNNFPMEKDICISLISVTPFRPLQPTQMLIQVSNVGTVKVDSIPVDLYIITQPAPQKFTYNFSTPAPVAQAEGEFHWLISSLDTQKTTTIIISFTTPIVFPGTPIVFSAAAYIEDDVFLTNNGARLSKNTVTAYDPNDKTVTPDRVMVGALDTSTLQYVIRFQNTGNYPADFVVIRDTLPPGLDVSTFKVLAASHPYSWRMFGNRIVEFRFDPIYLPDSTANEPESHGFIAFNIKPQKGLVVGESVGNRAGIYFDFNDPVITNTAVLSVTNEVSTAEPNQIDWFDFGLSPNPVPAFSNILVELQNAPREAPVVNIYDMLGKLVQQTHEALGSTRIVLGGLPAGNYFVQVRLGSLASGKILIVQ